MTHAQWYCGYMLVGNMLSWELFFFKSLLANLLFRSYYIIQYIQGGNILIENVVRLNFGGKKSLCSLISYGHLQELYSLFFYLFEAPYDKRTLGHSSVLSSIIKTD